MPQFFAGDEGINEIDEQHRRRAHADDHREDAEDRLRKHHLFHDRVVGERLPEEICEGKNHGQEGEAGSDAQEPLRRPHQAWAEVEKNEEVRRGGDHGRRKRDDALEAGKIRRERDTGAETENDGARDVERREEGQVEILEDGAPRDAKFSRPFRLPPFRRVLLSRDHVEVFGHVDVRSPAQFGGEAVSDDFGYLSSPVPAVEPVGDLGRFVAWQRPEGEEAGADEAAKLDDDSHGDADHDEARAEGGKAPERRRVVEEKHGGELTRGGHENEEGRQRDAGHSRHVDAHAPAALEDQSKNDRQGAQRERAADRGDDVSDGAALGVGRGRIGVAELPPGGRAHEAGVLVLQHVRLSAFRQRVDGFEPRLRHRDGAAGAQERGEARNLLQILDLLWKDVL